MPLPDGNSARVHPASCDIARSACDAPREAAETAKRYLCLDDFARHGSAEHIRSVLGSVWEGLTVAFKKDFLAKVAVLQQAISGRHFFEVRDDYSKEKVGEVTAFSGSLEVYK